MNSNTRIIARTTMHTGPGAAPSTKGTSVLPTVAKFHYCSHHDTRRQVRTDGSGSVHG